MNIHIVSILAIIICFRHYFIDCSRIGGCKVMRVRGRRNFFFLGMRSVPFRGQFSVGLVDFVVVMAALRDNWLNMNLSEFYYASISHL